MLQTNMVPTEKLNTNVCRVDFSKADLCSYSNPVSCSIDGTNIPVIGNWRDLLVSITDYCIENYAVKTENLKTAWFSNHIDRPFLLSKKPPEEGKKLSNGYWIYTHNSIPELISVIARLCRYCGINLDNIEIIYTPKINREFSRSTAANSCDSDSRNFEQSTITVNLPDSIIKTLEKEYSNGFKFDTTAIRLLSDKSGVDVDGGIQTALKRIMFRRNDDVYFLLDTVADAETREKILAVTDTLLDIFYGCFEISMLHAFFVDNLNHKCIDGLENFEAFYEFINKRDVRCVAAYGTRIVRVQSKSIHDLSVNIAAKVITIAHDEYGGVVSEFDLVKYFPAFSDALLANIIREHAEELVRTEINGVICYQTLDALGLSDDFSDTLAEVLDQLDGLDLIPSEETLHTALSLRLGVNFKSEYNITDDKTYRRLIVTYYKGTPKREWRRGIFAEMPN